MTTAEAQRARADLQARYDTADAAARAAKARERAARRDAQRWRDIQRRLENEAHRLGLDLLISHRQSPEA